MNQKAPIKDIINSIECIMLESNRKRKQINNNKIRQMERQEERINFFLERFCEIKKTLFCDAIKESP